MIFPRIIRGLTSIKYIVVTTQQTPTYINMIVFIQEKTGINFFLDFVYQKTIQIKNGMCIKKQ